MAIATKQFQILSDMNLIWDFLVDVYDRRGGGVAAPFFEYAVSSAWMDTSYHYLNRIWLENDQVVAFVFNESPITDIFFKIRPGYEFLAKEMIDYACDYMPDFGNRQQLMLFNGQECLMEEAKKAGFELLYDYDEMIFDFQNELNYEIPDGFHFVDAKAVDPVKLARCCWYGFNHHEDKGEFEHWTDEDRNHQWTPQKAFKNNQSFILSPPPHSTNDFDVIIADANDEYACYSGMWWVPQNGLAYMEPLCTIPKYRRMGLAAAALTKHYRTLKPLGATHMTGGSNAFYEKIGYSKGFHWYCFKKGITI